MSSKCLIFIFMMCIGICIKADDSVIERKLGSYQFNIPIENLEEDEKPGLLSWLTFGDDDSRDVLLHFSAKEIKDMVSSYIENDGDYTENIVAHLFVLSEGERDHNHSSSGYSDLWNATGSYRKRRIIQSMNGTFKVYREVEFPYSWAVLSREPVGVIPKRSSEFLVAQCVEKGSSLTVSKKLVTCESQVLIDDILVKFSISEKNLGSIKAVKEVLRKTVLSWLEERS